MKGQNGMHAGPGSRTSGRESICASAQAAPSQTLCTSFSPWLPSPGLNAAMGVSQLLWAITTPQLLQGGERYSIDTLVKSAVTYWKEFVDQERLHQRRCPRCPWILQNLSRTLQVSQGRSWCPQDDVLTKMYKVTTPIVSFATWIFLIRMQPHPGLEAGEQLHSDLKGESWCPMGKSQGHVLGEAGWDTLRC